MTNACYDTLLAAAKAVAANAYAPYSQFKVGAAVLAFTVDPAGQIYTGANVENVSYGLTVCAERNAIAAAIAAGESRFETIAIWGEQTENHHILPCGACLQVIAELICPENGAIITPKALKEKENATDLGAKKLLSAQKLRRHAETIDFFQIATLMPNRFRGISK
ncbi:MAG: cytidine deaminase [Cyanobacteria bacterium P01_H01_bin.74]